METSLSISNPHPQLSWPQRLASAVGAIGLVLLLVAWTGLQINHPGRWLAIALALIAGGVIWFAFATYRGHPAGIKNNGIWFNRLTNRGLWGWIAGIFITGLYILLYFFPALLGLQAAGDNTGLIGLFDHLSYALKGKPGGQWFVYGTLYTLAILVFGVKFIWKYRHNRYQVLRTLSVMFFQLVLAFLLPELLDRLNQPSMDLKNMWPLNYYFFFDWNLDKLLKDGQLGIFLFGWGLAMILVVSPVLTYFFGKRWYCSWVCGCGGLAETAGDPFRHLSSKSLKAWKIERWLIYSILVFAVIMTILVVYTYLTGRSSLLFINSYVIREWYGFFVGAIFSGVVGVGFYPLLGSRVWCRFGCPMAAILGIQQKYFSRFRITTNGGQCISCGNCSTYCEMGIDVRWYAQRGQNIVRASCVGCGVCSAVCPRGVLRLENGTDAINQRTEDLRTVYLRTEDGMKR